MFRLNVSTKLALAVCLLCAGLVTLVTSSNIAKQTQAIDRLGGDSLNLMASFGQEQIATAEQNADIKLQFIVDLLASVSGDALASYNIEMLDKIITAVLSDPSIIHIVFKTSDGVELTEGGTAPEAVDVLVVSRKVEGNGVEFGEVTVTRSLEPILLLTEGLVAANDQQRQVIADLSESLHANTVRNGIVFGVGAVLITAITGYAIVVMLIGRPLAVCARLIAKITRDETDFVMPRINQRKDEIGALAQAIELFRKSVVETKDLQRREAERRVHEQEQEAKRQIEAAESDRRKNEAEAAEAARLKKLEDAQQAEREKIRAQADQDREALMAKQSVVVETLAHSLRGLSLGNLDVQIKAQFEGPYENLRIDFNKAVDALKTAIAAVALHSSSIRAETSEISSSASNLASRTEKQAATLKETAAALNKLSTSVQSACEAAQVASDRAETARALANDSGEIAHAAAGSMDGIKSSSDEISSIVKIIDDIAFQTNLLALNAGVEAARAGEAGRGFAVVATEVRALAQRSAEAARDINDLITSSAAQVQCGVELVQKTGASLGEIVSSVSEVSKLMSMIAASTEEQSNGLGEVNGAINQSDQVAQQNAAMFEETTAACQALNSETDALANAVSHFKIPDLQLENESTGSDHQRHRFAQAG